MEFKYYKFGKNIYSSVFERCRGEKYIFIFNSESEKSSAKPYYSELFKFEDNLLITMQELKDMIFPTKNPVLREEKRILIFYKILTEEERNFFGINSYFDAIDIANNFFILMSELTEAMIEDAERKVEMNEKQIKIYEKFRNIKKRYEEKLKELSFEDYIILNKIENFDISVLTNYKKIVFINTPYFTILEKEIINLISNKFELELHIFGNCNDYCEENMYMREIKADENVINKNNLKIVSFDDKFIETSLLSEAVLDVKNSAIIECDSDGGYTKFLSSNIFSMENSIEFTETTLFKFIAGVYNLYSSIEIIGGNRFLNSEKLLDFLTVEEFREYFNISNIKEIISIINEGNKYINSSVKSVSLIFNEMEKIESIKTIGEMLNYLLAIEIKKLNDINFKNTEEIYFSAIFEMSSMESMKIIEEKEYELFFGKRVAENIFRLILKFLRFKKVTKSYVREKRVNKIFEFKSCDIILNGYEKIIFLNTIEGIVPLKKGNNFLFTEKQRKELGFITYEEKRNYEKFKFISLLASAPNIEIYTIYNENKNISISSYVEEIMINLDIKCEDKSSYSKDYNNILKAIYKDEKEYNFEIKELIKRDNECDNLKIGYYDFSTLKSCNYKFYLRKIAEVGKEYPEISYSPEMAVIGIIVHDIFRVVFEEIKKDGIDKFNKEKAVKIIKSRIKENREKFPVSYIPYYEKIIAEHIADSIWQFIEENRERIDAADIYPEKRVERAVENSSIKLSGRLDLMSVKNGYSSIFDYKTGGGNMEQLDFYQSLINGDEDEEMNKIIYSVFKMENEVNQKRKLFFSDIESIINDFVQSKVYKKSQSLKECQWCEYQEICRPNEQITEQIEKD